mgnify:CR=1 FL=1
MCLNCLLTSSTSCARRNSTSQCCSIFRPITSTITGNVVTATKAGIAVVGTGAAGSAITANTVGLDRARSGRVGSPLFGIRSDGAKGTTIGNNAVAATGWDVTVSGSTTTVLDNYTVIWSDYAVHFNILDSIQRGRQYADARRGDEDGLGR